MEFRQADVDFEWDDAKNEANIAKHGISFRGAARIFDGPTLEFEDVRQDHGETRMAAIGLLEDEEIYVVYTMRGQVCRIISARRARRNERRTYRQVYPR
jgi:uncharacterized DUF497 family protein